MVDTKFPLEVEVISSSQVFPESTREGAKTVPLSIIDNTSIPFSRSSAVWFYDPPTRPESGLSTLHLKAALSKTLNSYRHFCGRLSFIVAQTNEGHTKRYRRAQVTYSDATDLGVQFITANSPKSLATFIPSVSDRHTSLRAWDLASISNEELLPSTKMSLSKGASADAPNMMIQVTIFACGSIAFGLAITHGFADAQTMCTFANDWASISRALHNGGPFPELSPIFDPLLLDAAAAGDIDAESPDMGLVEKSRNLPSHRFDWYKKVEGQPWPVPTPDDLDPNAVLSTSDFPSIPTQKILKDL